MQNKGTGAIRTKKINRLLRPHIAKSSIPFDWTKGYNVETDLGISIPTKDQGQSGSCGGQASAYYMATLEFLVTKLYEEKSAKSVYSLGYVKGGGMGEADIEYVLTYDGITPERLVPSIPNDEMSMTNTSWQTPEITAVEKTAQIEGFTTVSLSSFDAIAEAVRDNHGIIIGLSGQDNGTWLSVHPNVPTQDIWRHWLYVYRADLQDGKKAIWFHNSWGNDTGENGRQYITEEYLPWLFDAFALVDQNSKSKRISFLKALIIWLKLQMAS